VPVTSAEEIPGSLFKASQENTPSTFLEESGQSPARSGTAITSAWASCRVRERVCIRWLFGLDQPL